MTRATLDIAIADTTNRFNLASKLCIKAGKTNPEHCLG